MKKTIILFAAVAFTAVSYAQITSANLVSRHTFNGLTESDVEQNDVFPQFVVGSPVVADVRINSFDVASSAKYGGGIINYQITDTTNTLGGAGIDVFINDAIPEDSSFTLSFWMNIAAMPYTDATYNASTRGNLTDVRSTEGQMGACYVNSTGRVSYRDAGANVLPSTVLATDTWYNFVRTYDKANSELRYYINGALEATIDVTANAAYGAGATIASTILFGNTGSGSDRGGMDATYDELRILNAAVTASDLVNYDSQGNIVTNVKPGYNPYNFVHNNPVTNGILNINGFNGGSVIVYSLHGEEVINTTIEGSELNLTSLGAGMYLFSVSEDGENFLEPQKLILN